LVVPPAVRVLLGLPPGGLISPAVAAYRLTKQWPLSQWAKNAMLPAEYQGRIQALNAPPLHAPAGAAQPLPKRCPMHFLHG
jgi:hypothetical protein